MANAVTETIKKNYRSNSAGERYNPNRREHMIRTQGLNTMACGGDHK